MLITTEAVILRKSSFRETSLIVTLYSRDQGKLKAVAKGIRDLKSKRISHFEPPVLLNLSLYDDEKRDLQLIGDTHVVNYFPAIKSDLSLFSYSQYILEVIDKLTQPRLSNELIYRLIKTYFSTLHPSSANILTIAFELKLLKVLGLYPNLSECLACKAPAARMLHVVFSQGGHYCPECGGSAITDDSLLLDAKTVHVLFQLIKAPFSDISTLNIDADMLKSAGRFARQYIAYLTDDKLKTPHIIEEMRGVL